MHVSLRMAEGVCPYMSPLHDPLCPPTLLSVSLFVCPGILVALVLPRPPVLDSLGCLTCVGCCLTEAGAVALTHLWSQVCPAYVPAYTARAREAWRPAGWKQAQSPDRRFWAWHAHSNIDGPSGWP